MTSPVRIADGCCAAPSFGSGPRSRVRTLDFGRGVCDPIRTLVETRIVRDESGERMELPGVKLTVVDGPDRGTEVVAKRGRVQIGTAADADLVLTDTSVSRRHLEVRLAGPRMIVRDHSSTNGTRVDGVQVLEAVIASGALLQVGETTVRVSAVDEPIVIPLSTRRSFGSLLGSSPAMREVFSILERVAPTEATVLVTGETGTGKELVAEAVHDASPRSEGPFVALDCGAVSASLMESELFGHVRGAFTGAIGDRRGVFEEAEGGTLFLDELGELPLDLQPKLLRALEKREVRRVGESRPRKIDVRVVAATNRDLASEVNKGSFREDLYFRLAVVEVKLPPLRARPEDIPTLVTHFVQRLRPDAPPPSAELLARLSKKAWPGNVRELRNAVERALALSGETQLGGSETSAASSGLLAAVLAMPYKEGFDRWVAEFERAYLEEALRAAGGSVSEAARRSGVTRRHIQRLMKRHGSSRET